MKKLTTSILLMGVLALTISFNSCKGKMKDADIKAAVETALKADPMSASTMVTVDKKGVATITGECKDDSCKANCEKIVKAVKGVKSVVNNCTIAAAVPPPASLTTLLDEATQQKVKDGLKDIKGVSVEFSGDKAVLSGEVTKADRMKIMQMLASAKVKSDVSKLMDKK
jgi:osmotically-inducible protein OsmY